MIYLLKSGKFLKIGFTSNIENRIKQYKTHNPDILVLPMIEGTREDEKKLHTLCKQWKYDTEWFYYNPKIIDLFLESNPNNKVIVREPHVKIYQSFLNKLYKFKKKSLFDVLFKFIEISEENPMRINCNKNTYSQISKELNKTSKTIEALTKELIQNELIIEYNNQYIINPKYIWKGNVIARQILIDDLESDEF